MDEYSIFAFRTGLSEDEVQALSELAAAFEVLSTEVNDVLIDSRYKSLVLTSLEQAMSWAVKSVTVDGLL